MLECVLNVRILGLTKPKIGSVNLKNTNIENLYIIVKYEKLT